MPQALALPHCLIWVLTVWQVLALIHKLLMEEKLITQREAYYTLVQYFKHQSEFNDTLQGGYIGVTSLPTILPLIPPPTSLPTSPPTCLPTSLPTSLRTSLPTCLPSCTDVVALTGCVRSSLGICASSSGAIAGSVLWKVHVL